MKSDLITPAELRKKINNKESILVLDVRDEDKYLSGSLHEEGIETLNIPYLLMRDEPDQAAIQLKTLPQNSEIITLCTSGNKAQKAAALLREAGFQAVSLEGGLTSWKQQ
ncbi:rhodanese-like domain-containing protein [Brevibacillus ginsengisoli]|uniref:rhodanese-like domain-containing protein n=1 Tax=Brevibacillus ginsengisoli TaxID=363854 RepID=UPI003CE684B2